MNRQEIARFASLERNRDRAVRYYLRKNVDHSPSRTPLAQRLLGLPLFYTQTELEIFAGKIGWRASTKPNTKNP